MDETKGVEHEKEEARVLVLAMSLNHTNDNVESERLSLTQQHNFDKGMKAFGEKGKEVASKELKQ